MENNKKIVGDLQWIRLEYTYNTEKEAEVDLALLKEQGNELFAEYDTGVISEGRIGTYVDVLTPYHKDTGNRNKLIGKVVQEFRQYYYKTKEELAADKLILKELGWFVFDEIEIDYDVYLGDKYKWILIVLREEK